MKNVFLIVAVLFTISTSAAPSTSLLKFFSSAFPGAQNVSWYEDAKGYIAYYTASDESNVRVLFDSNEKFLVSMRYCAADKLPVKILADKKINFRDCEILSVNEVSNRVNKNYYILMQNKKYIYRVRYTQGCEFDIIEKFKRQ